MTVETRQLSKSIDGSIISDDITIYAKQGVIYGFRFKWRGENFSDENSQSHHNP